MGVASLHEWKLADIAACEPLFDGCHNCSTLSNVAHFSLNRKCATHWWRWLATHRIRYVMKYIRNVRTYTLGWKCRIWNLFVIIEPIITYRLHNIVDSASLLMFQWQKNDKEISWGKSDQSHPENPRQVWEWGLHFLSLPQHIIDQSSKSEW